MSDPYPGLRSGGPAVSGTRPADFQAGRSGGTPVTEMSLSDFRQWIEGQARPTVEGELLRQSQEFQRVLGRSLDQLRFEAEFGDLLRSSFRPSGVDALRAAASVAMRRSASLPIGLAQDWTMRSIYNRFNPPPSEWRKYPYLSTDELPAPWFKLSAADGSGASPNECWTSCAIQNGPPDCVAPGFTDVIYQSTSFRCWPGAEFSPEDERPVWSPSFNAVGTYRRLGTRTVDGVTYPILDTYIIWGRQNPELEAEPQLGRRYVMPDAKPALPSPKEKGDEQGEDQPRRFAIIGHPVVTITRDTLTVSDREDPPRRPPTRGAEKKVRVHVHGIGFVKRLISSSTEALDFTTCMIDELPKEWKRRMPKTLQGRMSRVFDFVSEASDAERDAWILRVVKCAAENHIEDKFYAWVGRKAASASERMFLTSGGVRGYQTGQWAFQDAIRLTGVK